ncbi:ATP-binding protein [Saccharopolyspora sp. ASAGF58]|uniref:ATP-binding protein n=1 Tax=Saccharopolyspora sp. ASAGF58 TaxID=2719023 RepID=UPI001447EAD9|nr:ATP-binding protein [Saccharopolyspora sp. ASAGF58]
MNRGEAFDKVLSVAWVFGAFIAALGVNAFGTEYRYGTITTTLLTVRPRASVLLAKMITVAVAAIVTEAVVLAASWLANVRLTMPDPVPDVPPVVGRTAYRVVQEALTNAAKHAPHAAVQVTVSEDGDDLTLTVTNRRSPRAPAVALPSSGFGLIGMRERVALTGGKLHTGRTDDGGYRVHAVLPRQPEIDEELRAT